MGCLNSSSHLLYVSEIAHHGKNSDNPTFYFQGTARIDKDQNSEKNIKDMSRDLNALSPTQKQQYHKNRIIPIDLNTGKGY